MSDHHLTPEETRRIIAENREIVSVTRTIVVRGPAPFVADQLARCWLQPGVVRESYNGTMTQEEKLRTAPEPLDAPAEGSDR